MTEKKENKLIDLKGANSTIKLGLVLAAPRCLTARPFACRTRVCYNLMMGRKPEFVEAQRRTPEGTDRRKVRVAGTGRRRIQNYGDTENDFWRNR